MNITFTERRHVDQNYEDFIDDIHSFRKKAKKSKRVKDKFKNYDTNEYNPGFSGLEKELQMHRRHSKEMKRELNRFLKQKKILWEVSNQGTARKRTKTPRNADRFYYEKMNQLVDKYQRRDQLKHELELLEEDDCTFTPALSNNSRYLMSKLPKFQRKKIEDRYQ